jgi:hypothetical protein
VRITSYAPLGARGSGGKRRLSSTARSRSAGSAWVRATRSSVPSSVARSTAHQSAISGIASRAMAVSSSSEPSQAPRTLLLRARKRWASSERLCAVMSSMMLMAMLTSPSPFEIGVALTADQRSSPVARTRKRMIASATSSPASARRPGNSSTGKGRPASSKISKRPMISDGDAWSRASLESKPSNATAASFANRSRPSGACAVTASATPRSIASS